MGISDLLDAPFYEGGGIVSLVPHPFDVAIGGRPYLVTFEYTPFRREAFRHRNIDLIRTQADTNHVPGEQTLNPAGLWRRSQETWNHGAGQVYLDRSSSDPARFRYSKGVDPWTPWQFGVLNGTVKAHTNTAATIFLEATNARVYEISGTTVGYTAAPFTTPYTPTTTTVPTAVSSVASDGYNVWMACGASGVYTINDGTGSTSQYVSTGIGSADVVGFAHGRLLVSHGNLLYNPTSSGALPTALNAGSYLSSNFAWVSFAEGVGFIYAAGNLGSQGQVFKVAITADGTGLGAPSAACPGLPRGEVIQTIFGYEGFLFIGSNLGVRTATADSSGNLTIGSLVSTPSPVTCFEGQGRFVWFGYTNFDATSTGLGRLDVSTIGSLANAPDTPGWASDLMFTGQGNVTGVCSWTNGSWTGRLFAVGTVGVVAETRNVPAAAGVLQTGLITYDLSDFKYAVFADVLPGPGAGSLNVKLSNDGGQFNDCGTLTIPSSPKLTFITPQTPCNTLEVQYTLTSTNSEGSGSASAAVHRATLRSMVAANAPNQFIVPIRLSPKETTSSGQEAVFNPTFERAFLDGLRASRQITTFQEGASTYAVTIDMLDWTPQAVVGADRKEMQGVLVVTMTGIT